MSNSGAKKRRKPVREHPLPTKRKAFQLYLQRYNVDQISEATGVPSCTIYGWSTRDEWSSHRDKVTVNYDSIADDMFQDAVKALHSSLRIVEKTNRRVESLLDAGELVPAELCDLATAFNRTADILLRVLGR